MNAVYIGFQGGDDKSYLNGALGWLSHIPYVGDNHWTLRHTITLPTALSIRLFGMNELAVGLSNSVYFLAFLLANFLVLERLFGGRCAWLCSLLLLTLPGFIVVSTYLDIDIPELLFVSLSFWCWWLGRSHRGEPWPWLASGVLLGLAFITRETSAALALFFGLVFLFTPGAPRRFYLLQGLGFLGVLAIDWLYLGVMTGNWLYRYVIDFNHDHVDRFAAVARTVQRKGLIDSEGNLAFNVWLDPVLNLLLTQKYTLLFWLLAPAALAAWRAKKNVLLMLGLAGLVWFLFIALNPRLYLVPRYFIMPAWCAAVLVAWWLSSLAVQPQGRRVALALLGLLVAANLLGLAMENTNPRFTERALVSWVQAHPGETVYTDLETYGKARHLFRFAGVDMSRVHAGRPGEGSVFFHNADRLETCKLNAYCRSRLADYETGRDWQVIGKIEPHPLLLGRVLLAAGLQDDVPGDIRRRLLQPGGTATIYRTQGVR